MTISGIKNPETPSLPDPRVLYVIEFFYEEDDETWGPAIESDSGDSAEDVFVTRQGAEDALDELIEDGNDPACFRIVEYIPRYVMKEQF